MMNAPLARALLSAVAAGLMTAASAMAETKGSPSMVTGGITSQPIGHYEFCQKYADESIMEFEEVRIPLFDANGDALDTQTWAEGLQTFLNGIGVKCSVKMEGLGYAMVELTN